MKDMPDIIKSEFPDKAKDISESLELINDAISSTIDDISSELNESIKSRDKISMDKYNMLASQGFKYEKIIEDIIKLLEIDTNVDLDNVVNESYPDNNQKLIPNYSDYLVNNEVEHTLSENFKHKRPFGFKFIDNKIIEANTWKDVFIKTCEIMYNIDSKKFNEFGAFSSGY